MKRKRREGRKENRARTHTRKQQELNTFMGGPVHTDGISAMIKTSACLSLLGATAHTRVANITWLTRDSLTMVPTAMAMPLPQ